MLIMICGPYTSGTGGDPERIAANRERLESFALPIYQKGHLPVIGEWLALPIIRAAGGEDFGDEIFRRYQYPVAHRLLERCDAVLRLPGESKGADLDVQRARQLGLRVFTDFAEIPSAVQNRQSPSSQMLRRGEVSPVASALWSGLQCRLTAPGGGSCPRSGR